MPVIPEKRQLDARVQGALGAQFWGQPIHSARVISGSTCTVPCEPPPLPLTAPSGLARTQLLVAAHAAGLPLFPAWCEEHGGAVFDRVLLQSGRPRWWWALTGRLKAQRMIGQRATHTLRDTLSDPDNYALAANGRLLLSKATTLRAHMQADTLTQLPASFRGWRGKGDGGDGDGSSSSGQDRGMSAALQLKQRLLDGYELTADLAVNEPEVDGVRPWVNTPLRLSVDVAPRPAQRMGPLLYRVGAHGVLAPESLESGSPHVLAAHMQGALALAGHATLWQAGSKPWQRRTKAEAARGVRGSNGRLVAPPASALTANSSPLALPSGAGAEAPWPAAAATRRRGGVASDGADDDGAAAARRHAVKPRREVRTQRDGSPPLVTPGQVQDGLQQTTWRLERLRTDLQSWASRARAGELLKGPSSKRRGGDSRPGGCWSSLLPAPHLRVGGLVGVLGRVPLAHSRFDSGGPASSGGSGSGARRRRRRHAAGDADADASSLAAAGAPLSDDTAGASAAPGSRGGAAGAWLRHLGGASRGFMEHVVFGGLGGLGGFGSHLAHDVGVRLFAGGGASLQVGQMRRAVLDFTRLEATVDLGLTGPRVGGSGGGGEDYSQRRGARHPAFGLDGGGAWHALTLSATQQLLGPVRLRADWRMALDSSETLSLPRELGGGSSGLGSAARLLGPQAAAQVARHIGGMRPSLLDAAYGLDVVVPGSGGLARGVVWYSPRRGEGGVELRLL